MKPIVLLYIIFISCQCASRISEIDKKINSLFKKVLAPIALFAILEEFLVS